MVVDEVVARLAARQHGVVGHRQLRAVGLSKAAIAHRTATGRLHRLHRGVYLVGHPAPAPLALETAALLACGPGSVLSHRTTGALLHLIAHAPAEIDVTVQRRGCGKRRGITLHRTRGFEPGDVRRRRGLPVTAPLRTILGLASTASPAEIERVVNEAQVQRLISLPQLERRLHRERGRRGVATLRAITAAQRQPSMTRNDAEEAFVALVRRSGLPDPETDFRIGPYRVDFAWPDVRLAGELDSIAFHSTQPKFVTDRRRWNDLDGLGWRLFRFTWWDVAREPEALLVRLTRSLLRPA